ncbi:oligosaccharide flippase family protein [Terribacillus halophilus]|uniref:oligosaccharide flippase family protein n=1 Tax=Terribacillus halophilus TaxID=361279 RepID=UPI0015C30445|nr:oligosaccharide flippase family protein [Terribacillus halophilus]
MNFLKNKLFKNIMSLIVLQGSNYIFPLLTFPFLVQNLSEGGYGVIVFAIALMQFCCVFVDYGYNITATKDISIHKNNFSKINEIYNNVMSTKIALSLLVISILLVIFNLFSNFKDYKVVFIISLLILIGNLLFPIWLFQGLEEMKYITYFNILIKLVVTGLIFIFIREENDIYLAILFQSFSYLLPGVVALFFVHLKMKFKLKINFSWSSIRREINRGKHIFLTNLWINFYSQGPLIILGFFATATATGYFGIGQKLMGAFYGLSLPFSQAIYPYLCNLFENNKVAFRKKLKSIVFLFLILSLLSAGLLFFGADFITKFVTDESNPKIIILVKIFSVIVFLAMMNTIFARISYSMNMKSRVNRGYSIAAVTFLISTIIMTNFLVEVGMALSLLVAELTVLFNNIYNIRSSLKFQDLKQQNERTRISI